MEFLQFSPDILLLTEMGLVTKDGYVSPVIEYEEQNPFNPAVNPDKTDLKELLNFGALDGLINAILDSPIPEPIQNVINTHRIGPAAFQIGSGKAASFQLEKIVEHGKQFVITSSSRDCS